jgi:hypothetical protein
LKAVHDVSANSSTNGITRFEHDDRKPVSLNLARCRESSKASADDYYVTL